MIDTTTLTLMATAWVGVIAAAISPGPNMFACVQKGMASGRKSAIRVAFGIAVASVVWVVFIILGFTAVLSAYPTASPIIGILGGLYLIYLGTKGFRSIFKTGISTIKQVASVTPWHDVTYGFLVNISNPKAALFWMSLSSIVGIKLHDPLTLTIFAIGCGMTTFSVYTAYGVLFSITRVRKTYFEYQKIGDFIFGLVFSLLGCGLLIYAFTHLGLL